MLHATVARSCTTYGLAAGQWTRRSDGAYTRPCGKAEHRFFWDSVHNGIADALEDVVIDVRPDIPVQSIFNRQNVTRAWTQVKRIYPLLGAQIEEQDGHVRFVVFEKNLDSVRPDEIVFKEVSSDKEATDMLLGIVNSKRTLSPHHPVRVHILTRSDTPHRAHLIYQVSHTVSDGITQATLKATLLDLLVKERPYNGTVEEGLALSLAGETLWPKAPLNSPRQRWRLAIAAVLSQIRPMRGGHTLPRKITTATMYLNVISGGIAKELSPDVSSRIVAGCRKIGITFGGVFPVIGQIAATRLLFRHYMRGKISEEEWQFRKREPMLTSGPINTRPMLHKTWYEEGGKSHAGASTAAFFLTLPFMPLGELANVKPCPQMETPPFSSFLSKERFLLRCRSVRDQLQAFLKHPLFFEREYLTLPIMHKQIKDGALKWRAELRKPEEERFKGSEISPIEMSRRGPVWTHTGSSFGATDSIYPPSFPLDLKPGEEPILKLSRRNEIQLHCRPTELYLGSTSERGKICMFIHWDANVYETEVVEEYLEEVCAAAEWYLASGVEGSKNQTGVKL